MPKYEHVTVQTADAEMQFDVKSNVTVGNVHDQVNLSLGIREPWFFGLKFVDGETNKWLKKDKKVSSLKRNGKICLIHGIKLFFGDVHQVIDEKTQFYFFRHISQDVLSGKLFCQSEMAVALASLQVHINRGPYPSCKNEHDLIAVNRCIPDRLLQQYTLTDEDWKAKIFELYKSTGDLSKAEAVFEYLKISQELPSFGIDFFPIANVKNTRLLLGVGISGLSIYPGDDKINPKLNFPWHEIKRLKYTDTKLTVKPVDQSKDLVFTCQTKIDCSNILHLAEKYHQLHISGNSAESIEVQQMKLEAKERRNAREEERQRLIHEREKNLILERRVAEAEREMAEKDAAFLSNREMLNEAQRQLEELQIQLMNEQRLRLELDSMKEQLEVVNERLQHENAESSEERHRLRAERDKVLCEIDEQSRLIDKQEFEKKAIEEKLAQLKANQRLEEASHNDELNSNTVDLQPMNAPPENERVPMMTVDEDLTRHLDMLAGELNKNRKWDKLEKVDHDFEHAKDAKVDKYKTLQNIRSGNTKNRIEQFESM